MSATAILLGNHPLLRDLALDEIASFQDYLREEHVDPGTAIIQEGDSGRSFYLLLEGTVEISERMTLKISRRSFEERDKTIVRLTADMGISFGEMALFEDAQRTANVVAVTPCRLAVFDNMGLEAFAQQHPRAGYLLLRALTRSMARRVAAMSHDLKKLTTALSIALQ